MRVIVYEYTGKPFRPWYNAWSNWDSPLLMNHGDLSREKVLAMEEEFPLIADFEMEGASDERALRAKRYCHERRQCARSARVKTASQDTVVDESVGVP